MNDPQRPRIEAPRPLLSTFDVAAIIVGIVIGVGIFRAPAEVAANVASIPAFIGVWIVGAIAVLTGALCYAELATANPSAGGEYHFLKSAYGSNLGFLFVWARMAVIQTGAIATIAFVFADYAQEMLPLGRYGVPLYAGASVVLFTLLNLAGLRSSRAVQLGLEILVVTASIAIVIAGLTLAPAAPPAVAAVRPGDAAPASLGLALVFVLLTFGGWNEAAYLSAEVRGGRRAMVRALLLGIGTVTLLYLLLNLAYARTLGLEGLRSSPTAAADVMRLALGESSALAVSLAICIAALSTLNVTVLTGGRAVYALGRSFPRLAMFGRWDGRASAPRPALVIQGVVSLALVAYGATTRDGFATMVAFGAPVFWLFLALTGAALFLLRRRPPESPDPFRVPLYPLVPLLFCATCAYMLWSSLSYAAFLTQSEGVAGAGGFVGIVLLLLGLPVLAWARR